MEGKMDLKVAGISEGISEVIVTTRLAATGKPNAAPIGIITTTATDVSNVERGEIEIEHSVKLYKGSQTLFNVLETNRLAANVTDDPVLFVKAAFENLNEADYSTFAGMPVLAEAQSWIIFSSDLVEESSEYFLFRVRQRAVKIRRKEVKAINRGLNAVIEATVLATRLNGNGNKTEDRDKDNDKRERNKLKRLIEHYARIVRKCGGRREKDAMGIINAKAGVELKVLE